MSGKFKRKASEKLVGRVPDVLSQDTSNMHEASVEMLSNAIREMRTYGEGFIIADQSPTVMDPSVIANTQTKVFFMKEAQVQVLDKIAKSRDYLEQLVIPYKNFIPGQNNLYYKGDYPGVMLNAIGFLAFEPDETYLLSGITKERVMTLVSLHGISGICPA